MGLTKVFFSVNSAKNVFNLKTNDAFTHHQGE